MSKSVAETAIFDYGGKSLVALGKDGKTLCVANKSGLSRVLQLDQPGEEPEILDASANLSAVKFCDTGNQLVVVTISGEIWWYKITEDGVKDKLLGRSALAFRDVDIAHSGQLIVVGGDDLELILLSRVDGAEDGSEFSKRVLNISEQVSQLSCSQTNMMAVSFVNGDVGFYSLSASVPHQVHLLEKCVPARLFEDSWKFDLKADSLDEDHVDGELCDNNRICTRVAWNPLGTFFALPSKDSTVTVYSSKNYTLSKTLKIGSGSRPLIIDLHFDPLLGNYLAAVDMENTLTVWNYASSEVIYTKTLSQTVTNFVWIVKNGFLEIILGTWSGAIVTISEIAPAEEVTELDKHDNSLFVSSQVSETAIDEEEENNIPDDLMADQNADGFIEDDDGAGYVTSRKQNENIFVGRSHGKSRTEYHPAPTFRYAPLSPGATPYGDNDRRYLTMNNIGYVSTVKNKSQNSITVSFYDVGRFSEYHFEDLFGYNLCFLNEKAALFGYSKSGQLHYRSHDSMNATWTKFIPLQKGERMTSIAATLKRVVVGTSFGYLRIFNQFGVPLAIEKMSPIVSLSAHDYRIFVIHYSQFNGITYTYFENSPTRIHYYQREVSLPLTLPMESDGSDLSHHIDTEFRKNNPLGLKSVFFSTYGDPCVFGYDDVLLTLSNWRNPMQSRWIPILDSNFEIWRMSGGKEDSDVKIWPLGLTYDTLNCIWIKGKHCWPGFPLPQPSELELRLPALVKSQILHESGLNKRKRLHSEFENENSNDEEEEEEQDLKIPPEMLAEEEFLRSKTLAALLTDTLENDGEIYGNENNLLKALTGQHDKSLLRLFATACSNQDIAKAFSVVQQLKQDRALTAAAKISERAELVSLSTKINALRESKFQQQMDNL